MFDNVSEQDWKLFREKVPDWQERYMARLNREYSDLLSSDGEASEIFWSLENRIKRDKKSIGVIITRKRSLMISNLLALLRDNVIDLEDLKEFSKELQEQLLIY